ncbi:MAG: endolytic transglycosylase MltG [Hyphomonadaceae bacterium]|nr:endolytic transglycosylase MltG [Hyphomonadaceae bacterium]
MAAARRARRGGFWSRFNALMSLALTAGALLLATALYVVFEANRAGPSTEEKVVVVPRGAGINAIGRLLEAEGQIRNPLIFRVATYAYSQQRVLKAGEYSIPAHASPRAIIDMLASGSALAHSITVAEGLTSSAIVEILARSDLLTGDVPEVPPEGSILPETYNVERGADRSEVLRRMMEARSQALQDAWARRANGLPVRTPEEAVILASIVEKETGIAAERPRVASVFVNRLKRGMRLESDPTIIYGVCRQHPERCVNGRLVNETTGLQRGIRQSEIALNTGYNTYQIPALPPTPIANPGRASIEATLNPAHTNDIFFVADGTGGHVFATNVRDHNANVARWRQVEREAAAAASNR